MTTRYACARRLRFPVLVLALCCLGASENSGDSVLFAELMKLARQGHAEAQYHLGMLFNNGIGVAQDPQQAFAWFRKAAAAGDPLGSYKVGCYFGGQFGVVPVDKDKALQYKLVAAEAGYVLAQSDVAGFYYEQKRFDEAVHWMTLAAQQGFPKALYNLAVFYKEGELVPADKALAYAYFKLAHLMSGAQISQEAQATLDEAAQAMTAMELEKAERLVVDWKSEPTPLTTKAASGLEAARRLVGLGGH